MVADRHVQQSGEQEHSWPEAKRKKREREKKKKKKKQGLREKPVVVERVHLTRGTQKGRGRRGGGRKGLATDREIGGGKSRERELVRWQDEGGGGDEGGLEGGRREEWDQFKTNAEKFGYKSSFDMDLYTTPLDKSSDFYKQNAARANQLAAEIEGKTARTVHEAEERGQDHLHDEADEEDKYSGVHRYVPPGKRSDDAAAKKPDEAPAPAAAAASSSSASDSSVKPVERKKLSVAAQEFKPGFNISFGPPVAAPAAAAASRQNPPTPAEGTPGPALSFSERLRLAASKVAAEVSTAHVIPLFILSFRALWQPQVTFSPNQEGRATQPMWNQPYAGVPYGPNYAFQPQQQQQPPQQNFSAQPMTTNK